MACLELNCTTGGEWGQRIKASSAAPNHSYYCITAWTLLPPNTPCLRKHCLPQNLSLMPERITVALDSMGDRDLWIIFCPAQENSTSRNLQPAQTTYRSTAGNVLWQCFWNSQSSHLCSWNTTIMAVISLGNISNWRQSNIIWWASQVNQHKESTCQCRRPGFDPSVRKSPRRRKQQPTPVFFPGTSYGQGSLKATIHRVPKE